MGNHLFLMGVTDVTQVRWCDLRNLLCSVDRTDSCLSNPGESVESLG